jgi:hypothetical protein
MYYPASDTIASEHPDLASQVQAIDDYLYGRQGQDIRLGPAADIIDIEPDLLRRLLDLYVAHEVVEELEVYICPLDNVILEPDEEGSLACDICDEIYDPDECDRETVYRPGPAPKKELKDLIPTQPGFLFISYSRKDQSFAKKLAGDLRRHGIPVWLDDLALRAGDNWPQIIAEAIDKCQAMLVIISPDSMASKWVGNELSLADKKGKSIFPLLYRQTSFPGWFELRFGNLQWADFSQGDYQANLNKLLNDMQDVIVPPTT